MSWRTSSSPGQPPTCSSARSAQVDRLAAARLVQPKKRFLIAENRLAVIAPKGTGLVVRTAEDLLAPSVGRIALAAPGCPLGGYTRSYLENLGLYDKLLPRAIQVNNSRSVAAAVRAGRAGAGFVYASDAERARDCRLLFRARRGRPRFAMLRRLSAGASTAKWPANS